MEERLVHYAQFDAHGVLACGQVQEQGMPAVVDPGSLLEYPEERRCPGCAAVAKQELEEHRRGGHDLTYE